MYQEKASDWLKRAVVVFLALVMTLSYMPMEAFADTDYGTHAYFRTGDLLEGSDGKYYYNDTRTYSNRWYTTKWNIDDYCHAQGGARHAYLMKSKSSGKTYRAYCLEQDVKNPNSGSIVYTSRQLEDIQFLKQLKSGQRDGIEYALLYGAQPDSKKSDMVKLLGSAVEGCNMDDWYVATQAIIWEYQQNLRSGLTSIPSPDKVSAGKIGTSSWRNTAADFFYAPIKNRPAGKVYRAMLKAMYNHQKVPSFTKKDNKNPGTIYMEKVGGEYWSVNAKYANKTEEEKAALRTEKEDYYYYTDTNQITQNFRVVKADGKTFTKVKFEKKGKNQYKIIYTGTTLPEAVQHGKKDVKEFTAQKTLAWNVTGDHYQTLAYGADDPVDFYFKFKEVVEKPEPDPKKPTPPEIEFFPTFKLPVHKDDYNPGWDGDYCTGMGDASLGSTFELYRDGELIDTLTLDVYGSTQYFEDQPWETPDDVPKAESGSLTHTTEDGVCCTVTPTDITWDAEVTYTSKRSCRTAGIWSPLPAAAGNGP